VSWFRAQLHLPRLTVDRVFCTGGGAELAGLLPYLERRFRCPVRRIEGEALAGLLGAAPEHQEQFVNALGAAIPYARQAMQLDLRSQDRQYRDLMRGLVLRPYAAAVLVLLAGLIACLALHLRHRSAAASLANYQLHEEDYRRAETELKGLQTTSRDLQEDLRGIAGRIFSGRDLLNAIRVFKQRAPEDLWITDLRTEGLTSGGEASDDTAIDRGSIYIEGHCKPNGPRTERVKHFQRWCEGIATWAPEEGGARLFGNHKMDFDTGSLDPDAAGVRALRSTVQGEEFTFWARFDFMPTQLDEVTIAHEGAAEAGP
jgi:cell division ATPase FtsA